MSEILDAALRKARDLGNQHGRNAAGWWVQENLTKNNEARQAATLALKWDEDGDPLLDTLPHVDLSGQWADEVTADDVLGECIDYDQEIHYGPEINEIESEVLNEYETAFESAARDECLSACRNELAS